MANKTQEDPSQFYDTTLSAIERLTVSTSKWQQVEGGDLEREEQEEVPVKTENLTADDSEYSN